MRTLGRAISNGVLCAAVLAIATAARADLLTADRAVQIALEKSPSLVGAEAGVLEARAGLDAAYSGVLPRIGASWTRSGQWIDRQTGTRAFGSTVTPNNLRDFQGYSTTPEVSGTWGVLNLSTLTGLSAARGTARAARHSQQAARNDVALSVRRSFYDVVQSIQIVRVNSDAANLARDDERRVRALFEVGSVSKSDLLKAQVRTAQAQLDSLVSQQTVVNQRSSLASLIGVPERDLGDIDTVLTAEVREFDRGALVAEAEKARPDILAAEADLRAASLAVRSANFLRLPYISLNGFADFNSKSSQSFEVPGAGTSATSQKTDRLLGASAALNWDILDWFGTSSRIASARARQLRAKESRDALRRDLDAEVNRVMLGYVAATEGDRVAQRALESAEENLKLTQQKYNVGSATILDLIDAQVQLQRARSQRVNALAAIRVAEATLDRVRGRAQ